MKIQILGGGCPKCHTLEGRAREALDGLGIKAEIEKITEIDEIMEMGVMMTPALAIDGDVKSSGNLLSVEEISKIIQQEA